jgi:hypothetical protein
MSSLDDNDAKNGQIMHKINALVCDKYRAALIYIDHWKKGKADNLIDRSVGTTAKTAAVRVILSVVNRTKFTREIKIAKSNVGPIPNLISYETDKGIIISQPHDETEETQSTKAEAFLLNLGTKTNLLPANEVYHLAEQEGISSDTLKKVKNKIGIKGERESPTGPWIWVWPL